MVLLVEYSMGSDEISVGGGTSNPTPLGVSLKETPVSVGFAWDLASAPPNALQSVLFNLPTESINLL